jgi:hypothetical protein
MPTLIKRIARKYPLTLPDQIRFYEEIERRTKKADKMKAFLDSSVSEREKVLYLERVEREELEIEARVTGNPLSSKAMGVIFIPPTASYTPYTPPHPVSTKSAGGRKCPTCGGPHVAAHCPLLKGTELPTAAAPAASATPAAFRAAVAAATSADVWQTVKGGKVIVAAPRVAAAAPRPPAAPRIAAAAVGGAGAPPTEWKTVTSRDHIRPAYAAKFEAIVTASLAAAEAYAKLAKASSSSEEATARLAANQCAMEVEKAKAAFAEVV